jgi:Lon protease-like protein
MIVEFPLFGVGINYFPSEISVLRIFEPRYLLLIGDSIKNDINFCVSKNLEKINQVVTEVKILDHKDISNAEQVVVIESINLRKVTSIDLNDEYPKANCELIVDIGLPPNVNELLTLQNDIKRSMGKMLEQGLKIELPIFEIDPENRILKLWELTSKMLLTDKIRTTLTEEKEITKRYSLLKNYVQSINDMKI